MFLMKFVKILSPREPFVIACHLEKGEFCGRTFYYIDYVQDYVHFRFFSNCYAHALKRICICLNPEYSFSTALTNTMDTDVDIL